MSKIFLDHALENQFDKIYRKLKAIENKDDVPYQSDLKYFTKNIQVFKPLFTQCKKENFNSVAIDGSGADSMIILNDIAIHLISAAFAADKTNFELGTTEHIAINPPICSFPEGVTRLFLLRDNQDAEIWDEFKSFIYYNYGETLEDVVFRVMSTFIQKKHRDQGIAEPLLPMQDLRDILPSAKIAKFRIIKPNIKDFASWMVSPRTDKQKGWFEQFREVLEYSMAHSLLNSDVYFKYLFLDGSMNMLFTPGQDQPRLAANYLLKDICIKARAKETCVVAVSKTTTFPYIYRIMRDLKDHFKREVKWFLRVPSKSFGEKVLNILKDRPHIPPAHGVTYLFHFSSEVPILRIDFDEEWWLQNIYSNDKKIEKDNEINLFQEIDWLARDVRYYGYFFDLALSHFNTIIRFKERDSIAEELINYFVSKGEDHRMFIHPRRRLGLI